MYTRNNESSNQKHELHLAVQVHGGQRLTFRYRNRNENEKFHRMVSTACISGKQNSSAIQNSNVLNSNSMEYSRRITIVYDLGSGFFPLFFLSRYKYVNEIKLYAVSPWVKCSYWYTFTGSGCTEHEQIEGKNTKNRRKHRQSRRKWAYLA